MSRNFISTNQELRRGDSLFSNNRKYKAVFQEDGNFVLYRWTPVWASDTVGTDPHRILLQEDTNLVMYKQDGEAVWRTGNWDPSGEKHNRMRLTITNDGNLQVEDNGGIIWNTGQKAEGSLEKTK